MWGMFNWKKNKTKDIPVLNSENLSEFDVYIENEDNKPCGMRKKKFYRASTELFPELIDQIQNNEDCSFITTFNEIIKSNTYVPKAFSVLIKDNSKQVGYREMVSSNIMNYFGITTSFEKLIQKTDGEFATMSVDFVPNGKEFFTMGDLGITTDLSLELDERAIRSKLTRQYQSKEMDSFSQVISREEFEEQLQKIVEDYMYAFIVRTYILGDQDFHEDNCGVIMDPNNFKIDNLVQFDYEATLDNCKLSYGIEMEDILYVARMYPLVLRKILTHVEDLLEKDEYGENGIFSLLEYENLDGFKNDKFLIYEQLRENLGNLRAVCMDAIADVYMSRDNFDRLV